MSRSLRLLILEDRAADAELQLDEVRTAGFDPQWQRVETETDYLAALDPAPDLILADYSLPHFDGLSALQLLRARQLDIPFILVTGALGEERAVDLLKSGATDFVLKENLARLGPAIRRALAEVSERVQRLQTEQALRRTNIDLEAANATLRDSRAAALNLMSEAVAARAKAEQAEESLRKTADELARSNKDLESFAHVASHDLQEPLRMVSSFMGLLQERYGGQLDETAQQYIGFAVDGATRMSALVWDLLEYARAGARQMQAAPVNLADIADEAKGNLGAAIEEADAIITVDPLPTVTADATYMLQLFQNLIGNAVKFRDKDRRAEIYVGAGHLADKWVFQVKDNGIGIPSDEVGRLFTIFERLHTRAEYPGTGIGLATCKRIVARHGGRIWVESEPGKGSTFFFTLPA